MALTSLITSPRLWSLAMFGLLTPLGLLTCCQHKLIYFPRPNPPSLTRGFLESGGTRVAYETGQGKQVAWLRKPAGNRVEKLWLVCGGNGTLALELDGFMRRHAGAEDAILLFDYPGYGESAGAASPGRIKESLRAVVPMVVEACGIPAEQIPARVLVFGHSLGAAVGLMASEEFQLSRAVLLAPFTSTMEMARVVTGIPVGFLVTHRFDNRARVASLAQRGAKMWILHGELDEMIPVAMGRSLAQTGGLAVVYQEQPGRHHNDLFEDSAGAIHQAMAEARR